jgi:periplasmic protein TonB
MKNFLIVIFMALGCTLLAQDTTVKKLPPGVIKSEPMKDSTVLMFVEEMPQFPGGESKFQQYLGQNIHYPDSAKKYGYDGTVYVTFIVEKDGRISGAYCRKGIPKAPELCDEAVRVISAMPKWEPGKMNGRAVRVELTQPVRFTLQ